jgi:DNA-binding MarR family transcriptional regulator
MGQADDEYTMLGRELSMFIRRWTRLRERRTDQYGYGLDRAAFAVLAHVVFDGAARLSALAAGMCVDLSVISRQVAALEAAGLVARTRDPADRRASLIVATEAGMELTERKREQFVTLLRKLLDDWTPDERAEFARLMGRLNGALTAHDEGK